MVSNTAHLVPLNANRTQRYRTGNPKIRTSLVWCLCVGLSDFNAADTRRLQTKHEKSAFQSLSRLSTKKCVDRRWSVRRRTSAKQWGQRCNLFLQRSAHKVLFVLQPLNQSLMLIRGLDSACQSQFVVFQDHDSSTKVGAKTPTPKDNGATNLYPPSWSPSGRSEPEVNTTVISNADSP